MGGGNKLYSPGLSHLDVPNVFQSNNAKGCSTSSGLSGISTPEVIRAAQTFSPSQWYGIGLGESSTTNVLRSGGGKTNLPSPLTPGGIKYVVVRFYLFFSLVACAAADCYICYVVCSSISVVSCVVICTFQRICHDNDVDH